MITASYDRGNVSVFVNIEFYDSVGVVNGVSRVFVHTCRWESHHLTDFDLVKIRGFVKRVRNNYVVGGKRRRHRVRCDVHINLVSKTSEMIVVCTGNGKYCHNECKYDDNHANGSGNPIENVAHFLLLWRKFLLAVLGRSKFFLDVHNNLPLMLLCPQPKTYCRIPRQRRGRDENKCYWRHRAILIVLQQSAPLRFARMILLLCIVITIHIDFNLYRTLCQ